jgi:hypothetical protein
VNDAREEEAAMECPTCRSASEDDASECARCGGPLRPRSRAQGGPFVAFPAVGSHVEGWLIAGPLVINDRGLLFFVREMRNQKANFTQAGIRSGGLLGLAVGALVDSARGRYDRPEMVSFRPTSEMMDDVRAAVSDAPDIPSCREFFTIDRAEIRKISPAMLGGLTIETAALSFRVDGFDRLKRASGFLKLRRYPVAM